MCRGCKRTAGPEATAMFGVPYIANKTPRDAGTGFASMPMDTTGLEGEGPTMMAPTEQVSALPWPPTAAKTDRPPVCALSPGMEAR